MSHNLPLEIAETIQTASIKRDPSPSHDLNPSTAASKKTPVKFSHQSGPASDASLSKYTYDGEEGGELDDGIEIDEEDIPYEALKPAPRRASFGPLPDLRFEQSYLASIAGADTNWRVAYITIRDQVMMPLLQGTVWSLALHGWRYWNRSAQLSGSGVGAKVRRWWYRTNDWKLPDTKRWGMDSKLGGEISDYYQNQSSSD